MPSQQEVVSALIGAYRLAHLDPGGVAYLNRSADGARRSFVAALIVLPAYIVLLALQIGDQLGDLSPLRVLAVEGTGYVLTWTAYAAVMVEASVLLGREDRYFGFLCAYNWSAVIQVAVYVPAVLLSSSGLLPDGIGGFAVFLVTLGILVYQWFLIRVTLEVSTMAAASLVAVDLFLAAFISSISDTILYQSY